MTAPPASRAPSKGSPPKKRKLAHSPPPSTSNDQEQQDEPDFFSALAANEAQAGLALSKPKRQRKKNAEGEEPEEKRLKRFRAKPPVSYMERLQRVTSQRMFLIDREREVGEDGESPEEKFDIAGSTGNIYQVTICKVPRCTCPDAAKGNQCKHIIYVMVNVLKAREDLAYQLALLSKELVEIFANAPMTPQSSDGPPSTATDTGGSRKPVEGDCPVCVMEFDESDKSEEILWCKGACGNNIHRHCFEQWARSKPGPVKCVYCRTPWKGDEDSIKRISKSGQVNEEGYVNVAGELGLSGQRDMSTYHQYWVRRQFGGGYY
ncbi:putative RING finger domain protein [Cadophora sp. MPI-SDFR-AT-0126]|nr:putative RING finger domain protein [Leotiomycetes sp. MPI-SDFR-AT-0126]